MLLCRAFFSESGPIMLVNTGCFPKREGWWTMSETMRAVVITEFGEPEVLQIREVERPEPGPHQILVKVRSSGLNRADLLQRIGRYPAPKGYPQDIPGLEYAGLVEGVGSEVELWEVGDRVMGIVAGGGYAEYLTIHERKVVRIPAGISVEDAGAIPEVFMTAFDALFRQMELSEGETVLIHAVGSGVGTAAVQLTQSAGVEPSGLLGLGGRWSGRWSWGWTWGLSGMTIGLRRSCPPREGRAWM